AQILNACRLAFEAGGDLIKLYFMIGLPRETGAAGGGAVRPAAESAAGGPRSRGVRCVGAPEAGRAVPVARPGPSRHPLPEAGPDRGARAARRPVQASRMRDDPPRGRLSARRPGVVRS